MDEHSTDANMQSVYNIISIAAVVKKQHDMKLPTSRQTVYKKTNI